MHKYLGSPPASVVAVVFGSPPPPRRACGRLSVAPRGGAALTPLMAAVVMDSAGTMGAPG